MPLVVALVIILAFCLFLAISYVSVTVIAKVVRAIIHALFGESVRVATVPLSVRKSLREARNYADMIRKTAQQHPAGPMRDRLELAVKPVDEWSTNLDRLERALGKIYGQRNLTREMRQVTFEIEQLHRQLLSAEPEDAVSIKALIRSKQKHRAALHELQSFQNRAELRIRQIASDLGATHAEMLLLTAKGKFTDARLRRLDENLQEQVTGLRDMISVMDEIGYGKVAG